MIFDEFAHLLKQNAAMQQASFQPFAFAHIATFDPATNRVKVVVPSLRDSDTAPTMSGWIPMLSQSAGGGYGVQIIPYGGATATNPTGGEQVVIGLFRNINGVPSISAVCLGLTFNVPDAPPDVTIEPPPQPGDVVIFTKPGSYLRVQSTGEIDINAQAVGANITAQGTVNVTSTGNTTLSAQGNTTITAAGNASLSAIGTVTVTGTAGVDIISAAIVNLGTVSGGHGVARVGDIVKNGTATVGTIFSGSGLVFSG